MKKRMKKILYKIALTVLLVTSLGSCKKFLEREPIGQTGKNTLFETVEGASQAMVGSYYLLLDYYKNEFGMYGDVAADNVIRSARAEIMLPQFNYQSQPGDDEFAVGHIWLDIFKTLNGVNNILNALPDLKSKFPDQASTLQSIEGQALVIRALCHFDLSRVYAQPYNFTADASHLGVPVLLKTPSPGELVPRKTVKETYDQIITDLTNGASLLRDRGQTPSIKVGYQAALALLSRVYLYKGDWTQSVNYANMIIAGNSHQLAMTEAEYKTAFLTPAVSASPVRESIFQLTNLGITNAASEMPGAYSDASASQYHASLKLRNLYDTDDIRLTAMFTRPTTGENTGRYVTKKYGDGTVSSVNPPLIQVVRLSEVYLNRAEAKWQLGQYEQAAEDLRIIAQRAHPTRTITISYTSNADLYRQIADERNRELAFENHRFFDLLRRKENLSRGVDCNASICLLQYPNDKFVLPLPLIEVQANRALIQNPGYN
jgi:tetratricopeptide (TPR) repeat protein